MGTIPVTRTCTKCLEEKDLEGCFSKNPRGKFGRQSSCKKCRNKALVEYRRTPSGKAKYAIITATHRAKIGYSVKHQKYRNAPMAKWKAYASDAARRGLAFDFNLEEFVSRFWQKNCCYCDEPLITTGIDRLDYRAGYTISNTVPCCYVCNIMKLKLSQGDFIRRCRKITKHWKNASLPDLYLRASTGHVSGITYRELTLFLVKPPDNFLVAVRESIVSHRHP